MGDHPLRLFVAVYPPEEALADLGLAVSRLNVGAPTEPGRSFGLAPRDRWHVTLTFLGDTPPAKLESTVDAVRIATESWRSDHDKPTVRVAGAGRFGRRRFTVLWAGLVGDLAELNALNHAIRRQLRHARVEYDRKPFKPHLTLARPGDRLPETAITADVTVLNDYEGPQWTVGAVKLMSSRLGPNPVHEPILEMPL